MVRERVSESEGPFEDEFFTQTAVCAEISISEIGVVPSCDADVFTRTSHESVARHSDAVMGQVGDQPSQQLVGYTLLLGRMI